MTARDDFDAALDTAVTALVKAVRRPLVAQVAELRAENARLEALLAERADRPRFPGDPGVGKIRIGANNGAAGGQYSGYPIDWFDQRIFGTSGRKHSTVREYTGTDLAISVALQATLIRWTGEGRVPMLTHKFGGYSAAQVRDGTADQVIDANAQFLAALPGPIWLGTWHEPDNDFNDATSQAVYRAAARRVATRTKAIASNVAYTSPMYMDYTFNPRAGRDWRVWHPNWSGNGWDYDLCDLDGIDVYNPTVTPAAGQGRNVPWRDKAARFLDARKAAGAKELPWIIGEHGVYTDDPALNGNGVTATQILTDMVDVGAAEQHLVGVCMWNSNRCRFDDGNDGDQEKVRTLRALQSNPRVVTA